MSIHCLHLCRVEAFLFSALDVVLSTIQAVHGNNTIQCCPFSSMATCMLIRPVEWLVGSSTMFQHTMASHPSEAGDPCHQVSRMVMWSGMKKIL